MKKNIQNKPLNKIELYSGKVYRGNLLFNKEKIVIFKEIIEFSEENHVLILRKENIREITEIYKEEKIKYKNIKKYIQSENNIDFFNILEICMKFKFLVFIDSINFDETKVGIIEKIFNETYIQIKLLDENYHFVEKLKIKSSEIDILRIKNYSLNTN